MVEFHADGRVWQVESVYLPSGWALQSVSFFNFPRDSFVARVVAEGWAHAQDYGAGAHTLLS